MKKLLSTVCAAAMAMTAVATTSVATQAAPVVPQVRGDLPTTDIEQVRDGMYRNGKYWYYNGHRGYRDYRPGYRRHGDFWFPAGAFIAGAIIGGALSSPGPRYYAPRRVYSAPSGSAHVRWCYNRYRSYDARSNTYQPYSGARRVCYSPYS